MIYFIGYAPESSRYCKASFPQFLSWLRDLTVYQLDIETTVTPHWCNKTIITVQFGSLDGKTQWVLQWSLLNQSQRQRVAQELEDRCNSLGQPRLKLIHNAMFECVVLLFHNIRIRNVYDTMLAEMVLNCGMEFNSQKMDDESDAAAGYYALTMLTQRYLCYYLDKSEQMNFGDDILTESKVIYAAADVVPLGAIMRMQIPEINRFDLDYVVALENEAVLAFAEMTWTGMPLDKEKWAENEQLAIPVIAAAKAELDGWLMKEPFAAPALFAGHYSLKDELTFKWGNHKIKAEVVEHYFPFLVGKTSKAVLTGLYKRKARGEDVFSDERAWTYVDMFFKEQWGYLNEVLIEADRDWLIEREYLVPAGTVTINWNSPVQVLAMLKVVKPSLHSTDAIAMEKLSHPIGKALMNYRSALRLLSTYGQSFLEHVEPDGRVRTSFNQIVATGRASSRKPNMQNIVVTDEVGTRYRNAFGCGPDEEYNSSDFKSQELVIMAYLSQEPSWMSALREGRDLHSICAEMMYKKRWRDATEPGCTYYAPGKDGRPQQDKCSCKKHKTMRYDAKTVNFGLPYGMGPGKLAGELSISYGAAQALIDEHARTFPKVAKLFEDLKRFGLYNGYIMTLAPFFRRRWFPYWKLSRHKVKDHIAGQYDSNLGSIEREAGNMPIQGSAGDMTKLAMVLMYWELHDGPEDLSHLVRLAMQVHDQVDTHCKKSYTQTWKPVMDRCMRDAALVIIPNGLLGTDTTVTPVWSK